MTNPSLSPQEPETDPQRLVDILLALDAVQFALRHLQVHFDGVAAIEYLSPEAREALEGRLADIYVNVPRLVVSSISERLNVTGWTGADANLAEQIWYANDLDVQGDLAHSEALLFGRSYSWVWAGNDGPRISIESARQTAVLADPGTREITSAVKRWHTSAGLGVGSTQAVLLLPDRIEHWASTLGAEIGGFNLVDVQPNPLGQVPVIQFTNQGRMLNSWGYRGIDEVSYPSRLLLGSGVYSEIADVIPLSSALSKALFDLMCCLEATGRSRRYASGIALVERPRLDPRTGGPVLDSDGNPIIDTVNLLAQEASRTWISENEAAKFGQLDAADLKGFTDAVNVIVQQILAETALSPSYLGVLTNQPPSADALRASESSLIARVEQKQKPFGKAWEQTMQLAIAVETGRDPRTVDAKPVWRPADQSSEAQAADAVVKLYQAGLLPRSTALRRLGYTDQEIEAIRADTTDDVVAEKKGDPMSAYLNRQNPHL
jgi:hypothetical protein